MANRGNIFSALLAGLRDTSGESLSGGVVYFYTPGTVVAKSVYTDADLTAAVDSVELDSNGQAEIYGRGLYDVVVKDADGTTLYSWERVFLGKDVFVATDILADYIATADDSLILVDTAGGNVVVTLPDPATMQQAPYIVKTTSDANTVTIQRSGTTINGSANYVLSDQWEGVQIAFDDYNFYTLGNYASFATTITTEATTDTAGKVELATDAEVIAASATDRAVTPSNVRFAVPAGAVMPFAQNSAPAGWLKCNGAAVSRTTYATLFAAIGETYGAGDGTTTFLLPDLRGEFVRGWDDARGVDTDRAIGTTQTALVPRDGWGTSEESPSSSVTVASGRLVVGSGNKENEETLESLRAAGNDLATPDIRPRNVALLYCIKF